VLRRIALAVTAFLVPLAIGLFALARTGTLDQALGRVREAGPVAPASIQEAEAVAYVHDSRTGWRLRPYTQIHRAIAGRYDVRNRTNGDGFIDREHDRTTDVYRIAFLGDSFVEAQQVPMEARFSSVTEDLVHNLSGGRRLVDIMNFGVSSMGTVHEYGVLKEWALPYRPNEVWVFFFSGNDLADNSVIDNGPPMRPYFIRPPEGGRPTDIRFGFPRPPAALAAEHAAQFGGLRKTYNQFGLDIMPSLYADVREPVLEAALEDTREALALMAKLTAEKQARLRLFYIPQRPEVDERVWEPMIADARQRGRLPADVTPRREAAEQRIAALAREVGVEFNSLRPLIEQHGAEKMFGDHFSLEGHRVVADYLARLLLQ
jgi:hypothetical protein